MYHIATQPFLDRRENILGILNDGFVSLYLYTYYILTDFNSEGVWREEASLALVVILFTSIGVNLLDLLTRII